MTDCNELKKTLSQKRDEARKNRRREDFGEMMERFMKEKGFSSNTLSAAANLSDRTVRRLKGDDMYEPNREMIIAVCVGMRLTLDESLDLLYKSEYRLRADSPLDAIYLEILAHEGKYSVLEWNEVLDMMGMKLLGGGRYS